MTTGRGGRRSVGRTKTRRANSHTSVQLAPGVLLEAQEENHAVLVCPDGRVQLNNGAAAILRLCDGSRDREAIVDELMRSSHRDGLAAEISEFLCAAQARGWIVEAPNA